MAKSMASTDDVEKREWVIACFITLTAVTLAFCLIRTASRLQRGEAGSGFDDFLIGLSWSTSAAMTALTVVGNVRYQFDRHLSDVASDLVTGAIEVCDLARMAY
jgi:ribonuclease I